MKYLFPVVFIGFLLFRISPLLAQITVLNYNSTASTEYINESIWGTDSIYIIYSPDANGFPIDATLRASLNNVDSLNFDWYFFNESSKQFDLIHSIDSVNSSDYKNAGQGGYKVTVENSKKGIDTSFVAWLFIEDFNINEIRIVVSACDELVLRADTTFEKNFYYYDLGDFTQLKLTNLFEEKWIVEPSLSGTRLDGLNPRFSPAPVEPTSFTLEVKDNFNYKRSNKLTIDENLTDQDEYPYLRAVKANFKGISGQEKDPRDTSVKVEAPYGVVFLNDSKNGLNYEWLFYNHPRWMSSQADSLIGVSSLFEPIDSIYYLHPAPLEDPVLGYDVKLFAYGPIYNEDDAQCLDTIRKIEFVLVDSTEFPSNMDLLPNVFNPKNGAEKNQTFFFKEKLPVSVQYFSIKIYNRWGNKVYEFEDANGSWIDDGHEGWDGQTRYGGKAKPGVYYYVILAKGWDNREFEVPGYVHIFW